MKTQKKIFSVLILLTIFCCLQGIWSTDPTINTQVCVLAGSQAIPKMANGISGDVYVGWFSNETGNYDVRLQRFNYQGESLWQENGILISDYPSMTWLTDWDLTVDLEGYCVLTFQDIRDSGNNNVVAYRISPEGELVWGEAGLQLSDSNAFDVSPKVAITSGNNAVVAWQADEVVVIQKISPAGTLLWGENGITLSCDNTYSWPQLLAVEDDNVILKLFEDSGVPWAPDRYVYAQKFDPDGNPVWADYAVISDASGISAWTQKLAMAYDGVGGFYIAWYDDRNMDMISQSYVQHISSDGEVLFVDDGVEVALGNSRQRFYPHLAFIPSAAEIFCYWSETDIDQNNRGIYGQRFDAEGNRQWSDNGKPIINLTDRDIILEGTRACENAVLVVCEDTEVALNNMVKAMLLDEDGEFIWPQEYVMMSQVESEKLHFDVGRYNNGQWVVTWEDRRSDDGDIYAQNVRLSGEIGGVNPPPVNLEINEISAVLSWDEPVEQPDIYNVYLDGNFVYSTMNLEYQYSNLENGTEYSAGVSAVYNDGESDIMTVEFVYSGTENHHHIIDSPLIRIANSPNPFNPETEISYQISQTSSVHLAVYNLKGELVKKLVDEIKQAGEYKVIWDGTDKNKIFLPSGLYLYSITVNGIRTNRKMMLLK